MISSPEEAPAKRAQLAELPWRVVHPRRANRRKLQVAFFAALAIVVCGVAGYLVTHRGAAQTAAPTTPMFVPARTWAWAPANGARAYDVMFSREGRVVFRTRAREPRVVMPRSFRFQAGAYRWTVRALPATAGAQPTVDSQFFLTSAGATAANQSSR